LAADDDRTRLDALLKNSPSDVVALVGRRLECQHWGGEEPYDAARRAEILAAVTRLKCGTLGADEEVLRSQEGQWETVLHASRRMRGSTLADPVFDIHYNARDGGGASRISDTLKYALVITLEAPKHVDLHAEILNAYPDLLVMINPVINPEINLTVPAT
jgi:hypothetical protein